MRPIKPVPGTCTVCGGSLSFPADKIGTVDRCPNCGQETELVLAVPPVEPLITRKMIFWMIAAVVSMVVFGIVLMSGLKHYQKRLKEQQPPPAQTQSTAPR